MNFKKIFSLGNSVERKADVPPLQSTTGGNINSQWLTDNAELTEPFHK